jgi:hypothetical protein
VNLDARDFVTAGDNRQNQTLEQRVVHMDVEEVGLEAGKAIGRRDQLLAQRIEIPEPLFTQIF